MVASAAAPVAPAAPDPRFVALARKEEAVVKAQQELAAAKAQHAKDLQEVADWKKRQENALRDPDSYLRPVYGDKWIEKLNEYALNARQVTPELIDAHVEKKLATLEQRIEEQRKKDETEAQSRKQADLDQQLSDWRNGVVESVKQAPEYELISAYEAWSLVPAAIERHFAATQKMLSPKEAAEQLEKDLEERARKTKKFSVSAGQKPGERPGSSSATISNAMTASTPSDNGDVAFLSWQDREKRAIAAAERIEAQRRASRATQ